MSDQSPDRHLWVKNPSRHSRMVVSMLLTHGVLMRICPSHYCRQWQASFPVHGNTSLNRSLPPRGPSAPAWTSGFASKLWTSTAGASGCAPAPMKSIEEQYVRSFSLCGQRRIADQQAPSKACGGIRCTCFRSRRPPNLAICQAAESELTKYPRLRLLSLPECRHVSRFLEPS